MSASAGSSDEDLDSDSTDRWGGADPAAVLLAALHATADIAVITDAEQNITYVSVSFTAMTGYDLSDLRGRNCRVLQGPGTDRTTTRRIRDVLASDEVFEGNLLNYRKDGSALWTALKIIPMRVGRGTAVTHYVSVQRDITNKMARLKYLESQALQDHLTGLPNRAAGEEDVLEAVKRSPHRDVTVAVGLIDLDDFRIVNNTLGHAAGDAVLQQWSARVLARLREGDVLARMGGDEFLLILRRITRATAGEDLPEILNRVHGVVEEPFPVGDQLVRIGMSMGIVLVPEDGTDSKTILRRADEALYTAKGRPAHSVTWWATAEHARFQPLPQHMTDATHAGGKTGASSVIEEIAEGATATYRRAVNDGAVLVHFQPIVDLRDGAVILFEALVRLKLPEGQVAHPHEFLPHLRPQELRSLFVDVLDQALSMIAGWSRDGLRPNVAVNLPPEVLHDESLPDLVTDLLRIHDIEPGGLGLELLESQTVELEAQRVALQKLAGLGVRLAMDDLGSGYSSLQRLSSFPFTAIKLDRGLFSHTYERPLETLSVMATLIQMGRDLGMTVVVEGLEDESVTEAAMILGAPLGQGYYFAHPMALEDCGPWFDSFEMTLQRSRLQTPLGALAYHWQFARLAAPHPLELESCPLTRFIHDNATTDAKEVGSWHALQHTPSKIDPAPSQLLRTWLTQLIAT
ncbi:EAL domain-containing protein [Vibrio cholerae]|nr:EAL domain-containing protein [Vibrio cholerae]